MKTFLLLTTLAAAVFAQLPKPKDARKIDPSKIDATKIDPRLDPSKLDPSKLDPTNLDPRLDPAKLDALKPEPPKVEVPRIDPLSLPMPDSFNIKEAAGGPLRIPLSANRVVVPPPPTVLNERSTLERKAYILNDEKCPLLIEDLTAAPEAGKDFKMVMSGQIKARKAITAADIRFALFDLFGNHISTQQTLLVEDIGPDDLGLLNGPSFATSEKEMKVLHTTFAFVAQVRLADGSVWKYSPLEVGRALYKLKLRVDPSRLEPSLR
jgi:WASH complex subunit FAM21